ncbi:8-oxo-dGDP phosphatase NUDT18 [Biomphalaria pfeifferi]|uniref:8-oxo-dGDP phosphatase NUDT18 n=1 Tax=Biomphalaria pfeifferi TaxID=112525 RepID=A0AAD8C127_BIOPF|nr:8-oxo-dGDP phosphatase NUDT18 [Biomphalaria pfeifferi]
MVTEEVQSILRGEQVQLKNDFDVSSDAENSSFVPKTKVNMFYICMTVLFNDQGHVLLVQEAKKSCYGQWYLPAGRLEPGETIADGARREVKEESGLDCQLTSLIGVEMSGHTWLRFTFTGQITGGILKTPDKADVETLQAKFFSKEEMVGIESLLRHRDILRFIDLARVYWESDAVSRYPATLPVIAPHKQLIHRVVIVDRSTSNNMHILACKKNGLHIPTTLINHTHRPLIAISVYAILKGAFATNLTTSVRMCGVLGVEHRGTGKLEDGLCITSLVSLDLSEGVETPAVTNPQYQWCPVQSADLQQRLSEGAKGKIVPLFNERY